MGLPKPITVPTDDLSHGNMGTTERDPRVTRFAIHVDIAPDLGTPATVWVSLTQDAQTGPS
jgi:hypothetical protein